MKYIGSKFRLISIKKLIVIFFIFSSVLSVAQISNSEVRELKSGSVLNDTSPVYQLPWQVGKKMRLVKGWQSNLSHSGELSQDFKMKINTPIHAARSGVVLQIKWDGKSAGLKEKFLAEGNFIIIRHSDSTCAGYWHLNYKGVLVEVGDTISQGQKIGLSGHTGYSAFPHLYFMVFTYENGQKKTIPIRFKTTRGIKYIRPGRKFKAVRV